jgi:hypothetical protein
MADWNPELFNLAPGLAIKQFDDSGRQRMKKKEFEAIGKRLLPYLPGFAVKGTLLFMRPIGHTLRAVFFDRSIDPRKFYVRIFIQPLFVPSQHLYFNIGWRLGGGSHTWSADASNLIAELGAGLKREALPFLSRIHSPQDVAEAAGSIHPIQGPAAQQTVSYVGRDEATQQAIAYALARGGDLQRGSEALDHLIELCGDLAWQREMAARAQTLKSQLVSDPAAAQKQLDTWELDTAKTLGLEEFRWLH